MLSKKSANQTSEITKQVCNQPVSADHCFTVEFVDDITTAIIRRAETYYRG